MELNKEEALRAKENAERLFAERDFMGAKSYALQAQILNPELEGISQMVATFDVYIASEIRSCGEIDYYSILGLKPFADKSAVKKQYKKLAVLLHPDKNKSVGADGAFKLVSEAWTLLSDGVKRSSYDLKRNKQLSSGAVHSNLSSLQTAGVMVSENCCKSSISHNNPHTFWTVCTSCKVQYEYLRKYLNKKLSCKNCRGVFIAVETGTAPVNGSFPYSSWSYVPDNGYGSHGYNGVSYFPSNAIYFTGNGVSAFHSGHGSEYAPNVSLQWCSYSGSSAGIVDHNGVSAKSGDAVYYTGDNINRAGEKVKSGTDGKHSMKYGPVNGAPNTFNGYNDSSGSKVRPYKKRKVDMESTIRNLQEEISSKTAAEMRTSDGNGNIGIDFKHSSSCETTARRCSTAPAFDARKLLIEKARTEIRKKLEEMRLASTAAENTQVLAKAGKFGKGPKRADFGISGRQLELNKTGPNSLTVPDPDFHDFDKDRSEECFKPKQIWALYDEEDGMPRLYCLIRQVISVNPFKIHISYLNSKTDTEFGFVNWVDSGFTKSCGHFRAWNSDVLDQVNIFSHVLSGEKAGRGGCVRIYPKSGEIWAVYRNWSPDWNRRTPDEVRHQYEMVEVLDDYSEELGVCVAPLVKSDGFKTVFQRTPDKDAIRWIPRREMLRFSHRAPSWLLKGERNLPERCWDLDPAAIPDELLQALADSKVDIKDSQIEE